MSKAEIIKLTFRREYQRFSNEVNYRLEQIENGEPAVKRPTNRELHRVGDVVNETVVKEFAESKRDFYVRIKS